MNLSDLLAAVDNLPADELEQLKAHIAEREGTGKQPRTVEEWKTVINNILDEFWGDSSEEEMRDLLAAIRQKPM